MKRGKSWIKRLFEDTRYALKTFFRGIKRLFVGEKYVGKEKDFESLEKPSRLLLFSFLRNKKVIVASSVLIGIFLFVFIAPLFLPMDVNATDPLQQNVPPVYSMRKVPQKLKNQIEDIQGFADFTLGLSRSGEVYVWGNAKDSVRGLYLKKLPVAVQREKAALIAAGKDHALALTREGNLVGWGDKSCGQYGTEKVLNALTMPQELQNTIDPNEVAQLACGYQSSALLKKDGSLYVWGNLNITRNLFDFQGISDGTKIVFTNSAAVVLKKDGGIFIGKEALFTSLVSSKNGAQNAFNAYLVGRKLIDIAANGKCIALLSDEGELMVSGVFENGEDRFPDLVEGEYFISLKGGARHFAGVTNLGNVYAWGGNAHGQCELRKNQGDEVFTGSLQTYVVAKGKLISSAGLKGYLMGTDGRGRDVFTRIAHGGKMTMTIGAVAVLVSTAIAVLIGSIAGYFGGAIDTFLMRVTEIFSSMPFLPFAMLLSQIIKNYNVTETMRIFIIMLILGALSWTGLARMIRGQVLVEREKEFVMAAKAMGVKSGKIAFRHIFPNVISVTLVSVTLSFASCLLTESSLSYLGFGVQQPQPTWGNMLNGANNSTVIQYYWWQWAFPALFLSLAVICINVLGDALRDTLDPKNVER